MKIAIIGSGISGIAAAHLLRRRHEVELFEAGDQPGGHTRTIEVEVDGRRIPVDTGFLVYTEATYPGFTRFLTELGVESSPSDMSFSVTDDAAGVQWRGTSFATVFAQPRNLVRPRFLRMLVEVARFNTMARRVLDGGGDPRTSLRAMLAGGQWSSAFLDWYLLPLGSSIWSSNPEDFLDMPMMMLARFLDRHGLLSFGEKPAWRTIPGGARTYVRSALAPLEHEGRLHLSSPVSRVERVDAQVLVSVDGRQPLAFDHVVLANHADQALRILADPTEAEKSVLGAFRFQPNEAVVHTDISFLPSARRAWASWNYHWVGRRSNRTTLTYHLGMLQQLGVRTPVLETLNPTKAIDPTTVLARLSFDHPILDPDAVAAQGRHHEISGPAFATSYCGAYWRNGFHEDGFESARIAAAALGVPW